MDFLKFLKRKQVHSFEILLQKAADEPAFRAEFIKRILVEKLFIIVKGDKKSVDYVLMPENALINIFTLKDGRVPVFTSTDRIFDSGIIKQQVQFLELNAKDLFNLVKARTIILNPDYGREFFPDEIECLLNGTYFKIGKQIKFEKKTEVLIGEPAEYPTIATKSLIRLFSNKSEVIAAYVAWIHYPKSDDPPHYIFALNVKSDYPKISQEVGYLVNEILGGEIFDVIQITGNGGIEDHFINSANPFYTKTA